MERGNELISVEAAAPPPAPPMASVKSEVGNVSNSLGGLNFTLATGGKKSEQSHALEEFVHPDGSKTYRVVVDQSLWEWHVAPDRTSTVRQQRADSSWVATMWPGDGSAPQTNSGRSNPTTS